MQQVQDKPGIHETLSQKIFAIVHSRKKQEILSTVNEIDYSKKGDCQAVVVHHFNPSTREAEEGGAL